MTKQSKKYKLNKEDLIKIAKGFGIAVGGVVLTYTAEIIPNINFGKYTAVVVGILAVLINAARKYLSGKK
jgi:hypothetical protein